MTSYIIRRLLLMIPTLLGILLINFIVVQFAPGGPVERVIAQSSGLGSDVTARAGGSSGEQSQSSGSDNISSKYRGAQGLDPDLIRELEAHFGFDKPPHVRFFQMIVNYLQFDFGKSFYRNDRVVDIIIEKLPVSLSLGFWTLLIIYAVSIPLGIRKAVNDGSRFDVWTSGVIIVGYAVPGFLFAVFLIVLFAGGSYWQIFPLRGLVSANWEELGWGMRILDYFWHITLPVLAMSLGGFASLTMLMKNSVMDEIRKLYVMTARAKGLTEKQVLYGHVFRNAILIIIAGFPATLITILFTSTLLIEVIFSLDGLGLLSFEAILNRDYPVVFGTLFIFTIIGLFLNLIGDISYTVVDPRIDFEKRDT
ncbi:MAG: microcin C ABC transporter permease YejB [Gammaproteobacteria bacterium]